MKRKINSEEVKILYPAHDNSELLIQASALIGLFAEMGLMLNQSVEILATIAAQGLLALAVDEKERVVGTAAMTFRYPNGFSEFGGWAIAADYQKSGIGKELFLDLLRKTKAKKIIAFGNSNSTPIFLSLGGKVLDQRIMHPDAFLPCQTCNCKGKDKLKSGQKCVDTIIDLTPIISKQKKVK